VRSLFERTQPGQVPLAIGEGASASATHPTFSYRHHTTPVLEPQSKILLIFSCHKHTISSNPHMFSSR
jgi:glucan phosphoethanolaminetransferase (alkaline phosphatase superfamily)